MIRTHVGLWIVLSIFVVLTTCHSLIVPLTQGEDELAHYRYISFIAQTGRLPINYAERKQAWYRADWPPFYHLLVGWTVSFLDTTRPHLKDVGESPRRRLVGEIFYPRLIIYTEDANWPWQDGILAWHIGRFSSILFSTLALIFTYLTALEIAQHTPELLTAKSVNSGRLFATLTTALLAFTPRYIFSSAMLSDDSLFILLSAMIIWLLLRVLRGNDRWWLVALMGLLLGLSIVTKYSTGLLPLIIIPVAWWRTKQAKAKIKFFSRIAITWIFTLLGSSWWFVWIGTYFNTIKTDGLILGLLHPLLASGPDVSMRRVFAIFTGEQFTAPERPSAIAAGTFSDWLIYLFQTFWGVPILEHDPLFPWAYLLMAFVCLIALIGLQRLWSTTNHESRFTIFILVLFVGLLVPFPILRFFLTHNVLETGQGRHILYPAAQTIPILLMLGLWANGRGCETARVRDCEGARVRDCESASCSFAYSPIRLFAYSPVILLTWSIFQLITMSVTYPIPLPVQTTTFNPAVISHPLKQNFGDAIRLLGYDLSFTFWGTNQPFNLTLYWQAHQQVEENYRVQVRLVDSQSHAETVWLGHPLDGLYPTRAWDKGDVIRDTFPLFITGDDHLTGTSHLEINLLHEAEDTPLLDSPLSLTQFDRSSLPVEEVTRCRLWANQTPARYRQTLAVTCQPSLAIALVGPDNISRQPNALSSTTAFFMVAADWPSGDYRLINFPKPWLTVANEVRSFKLPTPDENFIPVEANFANQVKLLGYKLPARRVEAGGGLPLTLYWQSQSSVLGDYVVFDKLLGENLAVYGGYDRLPREYYSTILWAKDEVIEDGFAVPISPTAPTGVYFIHVGLYSLATGKAVSLPLMQNDKPSAASSVVIGPIKVGGPPVGATTLKVKPSIILNQPFGNLITLLGYDVGLENPTIQNPKSKIQNLKLTLYWQVNAPLERDYTTFLHLRDNNNKNVAQLDRPPVNGRYPTRLWDAGEVVVDTITLPIDTLPNGSYTPVIGLYDPISGNRLSVNNIPDNEVRLEKVTKN